MSASPSQDTGSTQRRPEEHEWLPRAALVLVVLALIALAAIPALLMKRVSAVAAGISSTVLPAYDGLRDLTLALEQRVSSSRGRFLSEDPVYDARIAAARAAEAEALRTLEALEPRLGPSAAGRVGELLRYAARRDSLEAALLAADGGVEAYRAALPRFEALRDSMLVELTALHDELARVTGARLAEEARWTSMQRRLSAVLGAVAVLAALVVGWFARRQGRLRREVQGALAEAERRRAALERVTESRVRLIRGITHDVKNPLGAAKGYAELLEMGIKAPLLPGQAPLVAGVQRSVDGALAIIADLLDLARADSGGLVVQPEEADLREVVRATAEDHRSAAEAAGHALEVRLPEEPLRVRTDPARVGQVLANLLSNAIKYSPPPGRITVLAGRDGTGAAIRVSDTGPGIPPEQREAIFDEFTRLDEGGAQHGHGLGLAIARRIARLLGGDLGVEDGAGGGATFVLRLPVRPS